MVPKPLRTPNVLVVDDEALVGRVLARALGQVAHVDVAGSGAEALEKIQATRGNGRPYDLVVCDVMMPGMSGPELFDRVRVLDPPTADAFVFVTGGASAKEEDNMRATGARCVRKPLDVDSIRALIARLP
jgi:two-component system, NtrC family, sensor kinase